jgi:hypothetical protein
MNSRSAGPERWRAILGSLVRITLGVAIVGVAEAGAQIVVKLLRAPLSLGDAVPAAYYASYLIVSVLVAYLVYLTYARVAERRPVAELSGSVPASGAKVGKKS